MLCQKYEYNEWINSDRIYALIDYGQATDNLQISSEFRSRNWYG